MINGYIHQFGKTCGGVKNLLLTPACNLKSLSWHNRNDYYYAIHFHDSRKLVSCTFSEDAVAYNEQSLCRHGILSVTHTLEFHTDKIDRKSGEFIRELLDNSCCGLAAVITTNNNIRLVIGYSEEHGAERPLRLEKISADTGKAYSDTGHEVIRLCCRDTTKARIFEGPAL